MINCSIVIRTFNEEKYLPKVLEAIRSQSFSGNKEVIVVDSGSTDGTLQIAARYGCRIVYINKSDFSFGRSLNYGCREANGQLLIFISAHCIPVNENWLDELIKPFVYKKVVMSYGRQVGIDSSKFSEKQLLKKYFPENADLKQQGYFSNNANSCIRRDNWKDFKFDEELTGLEDMAWAKHWYSSGYEIAYCPQSTVYHIHNESWK